MLEVLKETAEPPRYTLENAPEDDEAKTRGGPAGPWELFEDRLIEPLHALERLVRSPEVIANVLEAAGPLTLERAGAILLDERVPG